MTSITLRKYLGDEAYLASRLNGRALRRGYKRIEALEWEAGMAKPMKKDSKDSGLNAKRTTEEALAARRELVFEFAKSRKETTGAVVCDELEIGDTMARNDLKFLHKKGRLDRFQRETKRKNFGWVYYVNPKSTS